MKGHSSGLGMSFTTLPFVDLTGFVAHAFRICESQDVRGKRSTRNTIADNFLSMSWQKN